MNLEEVKQFLEDNKDNNDVKTYLSELRQPTKEDVEGYLKSEEGQRLLQPKLDSYFSKGLETWKENNLQKLIDEKVKEMNPDKTPEQIEIENLRKQFEQSEREKLREALRNTALTFANEKDIPTNLIDFFLGEDEESTLGNLEKFVEENSNYVQKQVEKRLKDNDYKPPKGNETRITVEDFNKMTYTEKVNLQKENPTVYNELVGK